MAVPTARGALPGSIAAGVMELQQAAKSSGGDRYSGCLKGATTCDITGDALPGSMMTTMSSSPSTPRDELSRIIRSTHHRQYNSHMIYHSFILVYIPQYYSRCDDTAAALAPTTATTLVLSVPQSGQAAPLRFPLADL